jgi:hypothetical protein
MNKNNNDEITKLRRRRVSLYGNDDQKLQTKGEKKKLFPHKHPPKNKKTRQTNRGQDGKKPCAFYGIRAIKNMHVFLYKNSMQNENEQRMRICPPFQINWIQN